MMNRREMLGLSAASLAGGLFSRGTAMAAEPIRIEFTLFSAFYSPLVATMAGGFLQAEGLAPVYTVAAPGKSALASLDNGSAHVVQSAPAQAFNALEKGERPSAVHFAQINERDGFFLAAREADRDFSWRKLKGKKILVTGGYQPPPMFKYACFKSDLDIKDIEMIDAGSADAMVTAFRGGQGDYIHLQGPYPQQLEHDGTAHIVTALADVIGPCAFSSLAAKREWLETDQAKAFMRAYRKARAWVIATNASEIARSEGSYFKGTDPSVLTDTIAAYQKLGTWSPHVEITRPAFEATQDIFQHAGLIKRRYAYEDIVTAPPSS
jgi:NitT/TauT family transport system substrate-binding protein